MLKSRFLPLALCVIGGCHRATLNDVYVDLDRVAASSQTRYESMKMPQPPKAMAAKSYVLPAIPAEVLANSSSPEVLQTQKDAKESQLKALATIRRRLTEIYSKQADMFAKQQMETLGDADHQRTQEVLPKLRARFETYANARLPLIVRLYFLAGFPDNNPKNNPPDPALKPVPKQKWLDAMPIREKISALDAEYDRDAAGILAEARSLAAADRLAVLKKIEVYRSEMFVKAQSEATAPFKSGATLHTIDIQAAPQVNLPAESAKVMQIAAGPAPTAAPQVEFQRLGENAVLSRQLLERQVAIWASINGYRLVTNRKEKARNATGEFEDWRKRQEVGP